jgi:hypothetical protein
METIATDLNFLRLQMQRILIELTAVIDDMAIVKTDMAALRRETDSLRRETRTGFDLLRARLPVEEPSETC